MKVLVLGIDVNRASCDPTLYPELDPYQRAQSQHLDETARKIADFTADARDHASFAWGMQLSDSAPVMKRVTPHRRRLSIVLSLFPWRTNSSPKPECRPIPNTPPFLRKKGLKVKTRSS